MEIIVFGVIILSLIGLIVYLIKENNKQILTLTKALSAKNFNDVLVATNEPKDNIEDKQKEEYNEPVLLSDLSDEEADKIIKKQLEFKGKK